MASIVFLPFMAVQLDAEHGGSPFQMDLLALTGGLQILSHLQLTGKVISDCQSLARKLGTSSVVTLAVQATLSFECKRLISANSTTHWIKGHPERSHTPRSGWLQDQWGNYLADLYAGSPNPPRQATPFPSLTVLPTLPYHIIAKAAIRDTDWQFFTNTQIPMLDSPSHTISRATLADGLRRPPPLHPGAHRSAPTGRLRPSPSTACGGHPIGLPSHTAAPPEPPLHYGSPLPRGPTHLPPPARNWTHSILGPPHLPGQPRLWRTTDDPWLHQPSCRGGQYLKTRGLHNCTTRGIAACANCVPYAACLHVVCVACVLRTVILKYSIF